MGYMRLCRVAALLLIVLTGVISAQQSPALPAKPISDSAGASPSRVADSGFQERDPRYRLRKSDVIDVEFTFSPEFNQTLTVQPDGYISMKGAGEVQAENKTLAELSRVIASAQGKARVRLNALRDGLFSKGLVIPAAGERQEDLDKIRARVWEYFQPENVVEEMLAADVVEAWWRRQRVRRCESAEINKNILESMMQEYRNTLELGSFKNRFLALLAEQNSTPGSTGLARDPTELRAELDQVRVELQSRPLGLSFLIETVSAIEREAESKGQISDLSMRVLVACCGYGNESVTNVAAINAIIRKKAQAKTANGERAKGTKRGEPTGEATFLGEQTDSTKPSEQTNELASAISLITDLFDAQLRTLRRDEAVKGRLRPLAAALPGSDVLNRISRAEAAVERRFYKALVLLLTMKNPAEPPKLLT